MQHLQPEFDRSIGNKNNTMERRDFLRLAVTAGIAMTVFPAFAKTVIHTDTDGLKEGEFTIDIGG